MEEEYYNEQQVGGQQYGNPLWRGGVSGTSSDSSSNEECVEHFHVSLDALDIPSSGAVSTQAVSTQALEVPPLKIYVQEDGFRTARLDVPAADYRSKTVTSVQHAARLQEMAAVSVKLREVSESCREKENSQHSRDIERVTQGQQWWRKQLVSRALVPSQAERVACQSHAACKIVAAGCAEVDRVRATIENIHLRRMLECHQKIDAWRQRFHLALEKELEIDTSEDQQ